MELIESAQTFVLLSKDNEEEHQANYQLLSSFHLE